VPQEGIQVGIMASAIDDAVAQSRAALDAGASGLLMAPPFYLKGVDDEGVFNWFNQVFERIGGGLRGVIMYHIPGQTAVALSPELIARLRKAWPGVITGIKDSSGDWETAERYLASHGDLSVLVGDERLLPRAMAKGAEGSICGVANITPELLAPVVHSGGDGQAGERDRRPDCRQPGDAGGQGAGRAPGARSRVRCCAGTAHGTEPGAEVATDPIL
jgi:4-hydroxy-tetrahydrodipicolinate synthase